MNGDGIFTISDLWLWVIWLYFVPSELVINYVARLPGLARFFELSALSCRSLPSALLAFTLWAFIVPVIMISTLLPYYEIRERLKERKNQGRDSK